MESVFFYALEAGTAMGQALLNNEASGAQTGVMFADMEQGNDQAYQDAMGAIWGTGYKTDHTYTYNGTSFADPGGSHTNSTHMQENENLVQVVTTGNNNYGNEIQGLGQSESTEISQSSKAATNAAQFVSVAPMSVFQTLASLLMQSL